MTSGIKWTVCYLITIGTVCAVSGGLRNCSTRSVRQKSRGRQGKGGMSGGAAGRLQEQPSLGLGLVPNPFVRTFDWKSLFQRCREVVLVGAPVNKQDRRDELARVAGESILCHRFPAAGVMPVIELPVVRICWRLVQHDKARRI